MGKVYLDYAATTPVKKEVLDEMLPYFKDQYGNPSSLYLTGLLAKDAIDKARDRVAKAINASPKEIYFTSGGTEADNWAIFGVCDALKSKGNHIIISSIEHHANLRTAEFLEKKGFDVTYLPVNKDGIVNSADLRKAITDKTILISIMLVNNEIGTIQPVKELAKISKEKNILFHTDAVQALGSIPLDVNDLGVDFLSMSAHKIYGPKGVGALYVKRGSRLSNFMFGGGQESGKRAGTENVAGIVGFGKAAELAANNLENHVNHCKELRDYLIDEILKRIPDTTLNGSKNLRHPGNANITFEYIEGEAMLLLLDQKGICVSTGSACSSKSLKPSHVLSALGIPTEVIHGTLRFSIGDFTTKEDIDYTIDNLENIVAKLREISSVNSEKGW